MNRIMISPVARLPRPSRFLPVRGKTLLGSWLLLSWILLLPLTGQELTLRIEDTVAAPTEELAIVLRTYESRPVGQGQLCLEVEPRGILGEAGPIESFVEGRIFSATGDVAAELTYTAEGQLLATFTSPSASINIDDGPVAVFWFQMAGDVPPGFEWQLRLVAEDSFLLDEHGAPIPLDLVPGDVEVVGVDEALDLSIDAEPAHPGQQTLVELSTERVLPLGEGSLVIHFGPGLTLPDLAVQTDPRYGAVDSTIQDLGGGSVQLDFASADPDFNRLPGSIFAISWSMPVEQEPGNYPMVFGAESEVFDQALQPVPLELEPGLLVVGSAAPVFSDGFESGDLGAWGP